MSAIGRGEGEGGQEAAHIEEALRGADLTRDAVVVWPGRGERPWALVEPDWDAIRAGGFVNLREAMRFRLENASMALPPHQRPRGWTIARAPWPRDESGAPQREQIRAALGSTPPPAWPDPSEPLTALTASWQSLVGALPIPRKPEGPFAREHSLEHDLGMDSLDRLAFVLAVAESCGSVLEDDAHASLFTLGDLVDAFPEPESGAKARWSPSRVLSPERPPSLPLACKPLRLRRPLVALFRWGLRRWTRKRYSTTLVGLDRVDWDRRPLLIAQNHGSVLDPVLVAIELPARLHRHAFFVGFSCYFSKGAGRLLSWIFRIVPIDADASALRGLRLVTETLRRGQILVVYPEGERTYDGSLLPLKRGAAWLAAETGAGVVPSAIYGSYQAAPRGYPMSEHPIRIAFGPEIEPPASHDPADLEEFRGRLREGIAALMVELGDDPLRGDPETWAKGPPALRRASDES